jgi:hypothetical protein
MKNLTIALITKVVVGYIQRSNLKRLLSICFSMMTVVVAVVVAMVVGEGLLRVLDLPVEVRLPDRCSSINAEWSEAYPYSVGHGAYPPNIRRGSCAEEYSIEYEMDLLGYLGLKGSSPKQNSLLVFGDSFAFGLGVEQTDSFAYLMNGYNAGLWGTTFFTHALAFTNVVDTINPVRAVWVIYPPHLISASAPLGRTTGWVTSGYINPVKNPRFASLVKLYNSTRLSTVILMATGWGVNRSDYYTREWALYDPTDKSVAGGFEVFERAVAAVAGIASARGIKITPVFVPSKLQLRLGLNGKRPLLIKIGHDLNADLPVKRMGYILNKYGIPFEDHVDLMTVFGSTSISWPDLYLVKDAHWNSKGHKAVADYLLKIIK